MRRREKDGKGEGKEPGQAETLGCRRHTQGGSVKDGIQKSHVELKESIKEVKVPEIAKKVVLLLPEERIICEETHNGQDCERRAILHRVAAAEEGEGGAGTGKIATWPIIPLNDQT